MIDPRFQLVPNTECKHLYYLRFSVVLPPKTYLTKQKDLILAECRNQYRELVFDYTCTYTARFPDGQYACPTTTRTNCGYIEELVFSLPLGLDDIMAAVCSFKKAVPSIQFTVYPFELVEMTPEDFHEVVANMYSEIGFNLHVRAVSWRYNRVDSGDAVYMIQATDYDFI